MKYDHVHVPVCNVHVSHWYIKTQQQWCQCIDNGGKWRINKLQQQSVSDLSIYYDVETYSSMENTYT